MRGQGFEIATALGAPEPEHLKIQILSALKNAGWLPLEQKRIALIFAGDGVLIGCRSNADRQVRAAGLSLVHSLTSFGVAASLAKEGQLITSLTKRAMLLKAKGPTESGLNVLDGQRVQRSTTEALR